MAAYFRSTRVGLRKNDIHTISCKNKEKHIQYIVDFWGQVCYNLLQTHEKTRNLTKDSGLFAGFGEIPKWSKKRKKEEVFLDDESDKKGRQSCRL